MKVVMDFNRAKFVGSRKENVAYGDIINSFNTAKKYEF